MLVKQITTSNLVYWHEQKVWPKEYAKNININCISPGFIKTNMTEKIDPKFKELILAKIPSNRLGEPSDVANGISLLSSEMSNYITGETIHVNGGMYLG